MFEGVKPRVERLGGKILKAIDSTIMNTDHVKKERERERILHEIFAKYTTDRICALNELYNNESVSVRRLEEMGIKEDRIALLVQEGYVSLSGGAYHLTERGMELKEHFYDRIVTDDDVRVVVRRRIF